MLRVPGISLLANVYSFLGFRFIRFCFFVSCFFGCRRFLACWFPDIKDSCLFVCFLVSKMLGFLVSSFQRFLVSWFQSFKDLPKSRFLLFISIGPNSMIFKIVLSGPSFFFVRCPCFRNLTEISFFQNVGIYKKYFRTCSMIILVLF